MYLRIYDWVNRFWWCFFIWKRVLPVLSYFNSESQSLKEVSFVKILYYIYVYIQFGILKSVLRGRNLLFPPSQFRLNKLFKSMKYILYQFSESEYKKMPPLYAMDDYETCMIYPEARYCVININLHAGSNKDLMRMIQVTKCIFFNLFHYIYELTRPEWHNGLQIANQCLPSFCYSKEYLRTSTSSIGFTWMSDFPRRNNIEPWKRN